MIVIAGGIATIIQMIISWSLYFLHIIEQTPSILQAKLLVDSTNYDISIIILGIFNNLFAGIFFSSAIVLTLYNIMFTHQFWPKIDKCYRQENTP